MHLHVDHQNFHLLWPRHTCKGNILMAGIKLNIYYLFERYLFINKVLEEQPPLPIHLSNTHSSSSLSCVLYWSRLGWDHQLPWAVAELGTRCSMQTHISLCKEHSHLPPLLAPWNLGPGLAFFFPSPAYSNLLGGYMKQTDWKLHRWQGFLTKLEAASGEALGHHGVACSHHLALLHMPPHLPTCRLFSPYSVFRQSLLHMLD